MFRKNVVFVVGAGASYEYKLPLGAELKDRIAQAVKFFFEAGAMVSGDPLLLQHIRDHARIDHNLVNQYTAAGNLLANAIPAFVSVDEALHFVSSNARAVEIGKAAILHEILQSERASSLSYDPSTGRVKLASGWLDEMFSMAIAGTRSEDLNSTFDHVSFVNFNYDRVIEHYLYWALQERTSASPDQASSIINRLTMLRPYGSIGKYAPNSGEFGFGTLAHFNPFLRLGSLGTYTENKPLHDAGSMETVLSQAHLVIFIGFGFHPANLDLLRLASGNTNAVIGTIKGIHPDNYPGIVGRLGNNLRLSSSKIELHNMGATELLSQLRPKILMSTS